MDHPRRVSLEPSVEPEPSHEEKEGEDQSSARETKRSRGEPEQALSGEVPSRSADETLTTPKTLGVPSGAIPSRSTPFPISPGASSSS